MGIQNVGSGCVTRAVMSLCLLLSLQCQQNMAHAVATDESLGIEYDEQTICDVCRDVSDAHRL